MRRLVHSRRQKAHALLDISMTPMIDTALTLLIIFMISSPMMQNSIRVTLPQGQAQESDNMTEQELVIYIDKKGDIFLNQIKVTYSDLLQKIKITIGIDTEKTIFVKADQEVSYGTVLELVDEIKVVGGVKYVALATRKRAQTTSSVG